MKQNLLFVINEVKLQGRRSYNGTPLDVSVDNKRACHHTIPRPIGKLEHRGLVDGQMKVRSRAVSNLCIRTIMGLFSKANRDRLGVSALLL
jgi:hypothetical protein